VLDQRDQKDLVLSQDSNLRTEPLMEEHPGCSFPTSTSDACESRQAGRQAGRKEERERERETETRKCGNEGSFASVRWQTRNFKLVAHRSCGFAGFCSIRLERNRYSLRRIAHLREQKEDGKGRWNRRMKQRLGSFMATSALLSPCLLPARSIMCRLLRFFRNFTLQSRTLSSRHVVVIPLMSSDAR